MRYIKYKCNPHRGCTVKNPCVLSIDPSNKGSMNVLIEKGRCPLYAYEYSDFRKVIVNKPVKSQKLVKRKTTDRFENIIRIESKDARLIKNPRNERSIEPGKRARKIKKTLKL